MVYGIKKHLVTISFLLILGCCSQYITYAEVSRKLYFMEQDGRMSSVWLEKIRNEDNKVENERIATLKHIQTGFYPNYIACEPHWEWDAKKKSEFYLMSPGTLYRNISPIEKIKFDSKVTKSSTLASGVNGEISGGWGPISAKVGANMNKTVKWVKEESITMWIPPEHDGYIDYGALKVTWSGPYYYVNERGL